MKLMVSDGAVCLNCLKDAGISSLGNPMAYNSDSIKNFIHSRYTILEKFNPTKSIGEYMQLDENNCLFKVGTDVFSYNNLLDFELLQDEQVIAKGGISRAVAGGLLFGGVGAVVGSMTAKKTNICNSMKLCISLKNTYVDTVYIDFIKTETKINGFIYNAIYDSAQKCITALKTICEFNQNSHIESTHENDVDSLVDDILKFKSLLDQGIISQEEFDAKKKQLLGL